MRLLVCAGGSGGGVYPALSVLEADGLKPDAVLWVGGLGGMERELVDRMRITFTAIPAAGVHGVGLRSLPGNLSKLLRGFLAARRVIQSFQPDVMFFTGGYVAVPVALAGRRTPILLYVPDIEPGLALKTLARFADQINLIAPESRIYFSGHPNLVVTGHPTRKALQAWNREDAFEKFKLDPGLPTLLIFGGSKGARSINRAVLAILDDLLAEMQVVHIAGQLDWPEVEAANSRLASTASQRYRPFAYLHEEMGAAYNVADLVVARGGASAVGEIPVFGIPAIIVPYPYAWRYQKVNAEYLVKHGAAEMIRDNMLNQNLLERIQTLICDPGRLENMRAAMNRLAQPNAAEIIGQNLQALAASKNV